MAAADAAGAGIGLRGGYEKLLGTTNGNAEELLAILAAATIVICRISRPYAALSCFRIWSVIDLFHVL